LGGEKCDPSTVVMRKGVGRGVGRFAFEAVREKEMDEEDLAGRAKVTENEREERRGEKKKPKKKEVAQHVEIQ